MEDTGMKTRHTVFDTVGGTPLLYLPAVGRGSPQGTPPRNARAHCPALGECLAHRHDLLDKAVLRLGALSRK